MNFQVRKGIVEDRASDEGEGRGIASEFEFKQKREKEEGAREKSINFQQGGFRGQDLGKWSRIELE